MSQNGALLLQNHPADHTVNRATILSLLQGQRELIARRFGARQMALFGSAARDELRPDSDVDVLVDFDGPSTADGYFELKDLL